MEGLRVTMSGPQNKTLTDSKLLTTRLLDRRRDGCGWPMGEGCSRDEPAEQIRGSVVVKAWLNGLCKGQAESSPAVQRAPKLQTVVYVGKGVWLMWPMQGVVHTRAGGAAAVAGRCKLEAAPRSGACRW